MSGGAAEGNEFNQLVNRNLMINSIKTTEMNKFLIGINMKCKNYQGNTVGVNLTEKLMASMRSELYCEIIQKRNSLENEMMIAVLAQDGVPVFSIDGFYSNM